MRLLVLPFLLLGLAGCATNYANKTPQQVADAITVKTSEFDSDVTYYGPGISSVTRRGLFEDNERTRIVAKRGKKSSDVSFFVETHVLYSFDWRFYTSASFDDGTSVEVTSLDRQVNGCTGIGCIKTEKLYFPVAYERLSKGSGPLRFRLNSKTGENIITIPRTYIDGVMAGIGVRAAAGM
jgi:hypothetical protein